MAYELNGTNQRITAASPSGLSDVPFTLACWFNTQNATRNQCLLQVGDFATSQRCIIFAGGNVAGDPARLQVQGSTATVTINTSTGWTTNTWNHACGTARLTGSFPPQEFAVYLNAGGKVTGTADVGAPSTPWSSTSIGVQQTGGVINAGTYFDGLIAEAGIWNVALTDDEITSLAKGMTCNLVRPQSLVFYAPLIRNLVDVKGGLTLTNNNTATVVDHTRVYQ
jgi:hypothetical protein